MTTDTARRERATQSRGSTEGVARSLGRAAGTEPHRSLRRWPGRLALALVLVAAVAGSMVVWASPVLGLRTVDVAGTGAADLTAQVRRAVDVADGTPLARIDLAAVRDRVAAVGPVATATVSRDWPHTLAVTVTERVPVAATQANGRWWLLDASGKPYQRLAARPDGLMPIALAAPAAGDRATRAALAVLASLTPAIQQRVERIVAPTGYDISLVLADGRTVVWGSDADSAAKLAVLPAMLKQPGSMIDISDPTLVTVRGDGS